MTPDLTATLLSQNPDALLALDPDGMVVHWNPAAETVFGYTAQQAQGRSIFELIVPADREEEERQAQREALRDGLAVFESVRRRKDGTLVHVSVSTRAIRGPDGAPAPLPDHRKSDMGARILIIEDDPASRELVKYLLEAAGHSTLIAAEGGTAVRLAIDERPDLLICDLQLPVMNGYQVVQTLLEYPQWHKVPVIAVTAFSMPGDRDKALAAGFDEHISKPIAPRHFVAQIEAFLPAGLRSHRTPEA